MSRKRNLTVEVSNCRMCRRLMCDSRFAPDLDVEPRCATERLAHLCGECGARTINAEVATTAERNIKSAIVIGVVVRQSELRQVVIRKGKRRLVIHAQRGGALVTSEEKSWS